MKYILLTVLIEGPGDDSIQWAQPLLFRDPKSLREGIRDLDEDVEWSLFEVVDGEAVKRDIADVPEE